MTRDEFFNTHTCQIELRESKTSGSGPLPKIYYNQIPKEWNYQIKNGKPYVLDKTLWNTEYIFTGRNGKQYRMSPTSKTFGEIRKLSNTKNETWIFSIK